MYVDARWLSVSHVAPCGDNVRLFSWHDVDGSGVLALHHRDPVVRSAFRTVQVQGGLELALGFPFLAPHVGFCVLDHIWNYTHGCGAQVVSRLPTGTVVGTFHGTMWMALVGWHYIAGLLWYVRLLGSVRGGT